MAGTNPDLKFANFAPGGPAERCTVPLGFIFTRGQEFSAHTSLCSTKAESHCCNRLPSLQADSERN